MIRPLAVAAAVASLAALSLVACQPSGEAGKTAGDAALPPGDAIPATYDWHFYAHGGTGEMDFGDGDWAEGISLFGLSCLPNSRSVQMNWGFDEEAVLTSGTATGTFQPGTSAATDDPVITALKSSGAIDVGLSGADMRLVAKTSGRGAIAAFFDYCDKGIDPSYSAEAAAAEDEARASAAAAEIAAQAGEAAPATESAPAVEAPGI